MKGLSVNDVNMWPKIAVFDIEAKNWTEVFIVGHVDEYGNIKAFKSMKGYLKWLFWKFPGEIVWAHYGGKYDVRFVLSEVCKANGSWRTFESGGMLVITNVYDEETKRTIKFCDSSRLIVGSVAKIGKMVSLPKLDVDRSHMNDVPLNDAIEYCIRDCEIVLRGLQVIRDATEQAGCDFAFTLASMLARWVRKSEVLDFSEFVDKSDMTVEKREFLLADEFSESAYFGGRVEVFRRGKFEYPLYYYDIRSSYPASMLNDLPSYFVDFYPAPKSKDKEKIRKYLSYCGITEAIVTVEPGTQYFPVLPVNYKGKLVFPEGQFQGRWTNIELLAAMDRGAKIEPIVQARYIPRPFLRKFIETFFALRKLAIEKGDEARAYTYKIAMNSLYGKLAETIKRSHILFGNYEYAQAVSSHGIENIYPHSKVDGVYELRIESRGPFRHVAAGSYITAYSRLLLLNYLEMCVKSGGRVYYSDTDSLVTDIVLDEQPDELGNLKLEHKFVMGEFLAPKVYRGLVCPGAKIGSNSICDGYNIYKVKGMPVSLINDKVASQKESFHRWLAYKQKVHPEPIDKSVWIENNWNEEYLTSKEGITGFRQDLNNGKIEPSPVKLIRIMQNQDSKRAHTGDESRPIVING